MAFVHIRMERGHMRHLKLLRQTLAGMHNVLQCHSVTGALNYVSMVIERDLEENKPQSGLPLEE